MHDSQFAGLAFAGASPFLICAVLPLLGIESLWAFGALDALAAIYGLAILCFLCGTHWSIQLMRPERAPLNLFFLSNVVFLIVWFTYVLADLAVLLTVQVAAFVVLLLVDRRLRYRELVSGSYLRVRSIATAVAAVSLAVIAISQ